MGPGPGRELPLRSKTSLGSGAHWTLPWRLQGRVSPPGGQAALEGAEGGSPAALGLGVWVWRGLRRSSSLQSREGCEGAGPGSRGVRVGASREVLWALGGGSPAALGAGVGSGEKCWPSRRRVGWGVLGGPGRPGGPRRGSERGGGGGSQAAPSPCRPGQSRSPAAQTAREDVAARSRAPSRDARSEPAARLERPGPSRGRGRGTQARKDAAGGATLPSNGDPRKALGGSSRTPSSSQGPPQPECRGCRSATALNILAGCAHLLTAQTEALLSLLINDP